MKRTIIYSLLLAFLLSMSGVMAQDLTGIRIHINPGHGGWDSDDRGISTPLIPNVGPNRGFWESQSNLDKGLQLRDMLLELGASVQMSRTQNRTQDDLPLSQIVRMANEYQADFMLSIHSNAGAGVANYVLMLFAGISDGDTHTYPTPTPKSDESRDISTEIAKNLIKNKITHWTSSTYNVSGDKTFARQAMGWSDGYGVLRGLTVPGVISEGSMHDYIPETYRLMNMEYKWLEAWNFKKAFCTYFRNAEISTGNIAGYIKDSRNLLLDGPYRKYGKDLLLPIDNAKVTIEETGEVYTTDEMRNGVFVFKDLVPGNYTLKVEADGYYSEMRVVNVLKNEINYSNFELNMKRSTPPEVVSYSPNVEPGELVNASTDIVLEFNWDMDEASTKAAFSITPHADGKIMFEDSQYRMRFKPDMPLEKSTLYTVKLDKSASHPDNLSMVEDFTFSFTTKDRNRLMLVRNYPKDGDDGVYAAKPLFNLVFDQTLDNSNAVRDEINVVKPDGSLIGKATRSIKFNRVGNSYGDIYFEITEPLVAGEQYKLRIGGDVMDDSGVTVVEPIDINFTASDVVVTDKTVIDDFDTAGKYSFNADLSENSTSASMVRSTSQKLFGSAAYRIRAKFAEDEASAVFDLADSQVTTETNKLFGLHVYGDLSGNELQLQFTSTEQASDVRYLTLCNLDFMGWEFVEAAFPEGETDYRLTGFRVLYNEGIMSQSLDIYVDNLLQYEESITGLLKNEHKLALRVYPNPATNLVYVEHPEGERADMLQFLSLDGRVIAISNEQTLDVSKFAEGSYVIRAIYGDKHYSTILFVK